jgi:alpha-methylacyl-CoA racemase
LWNNVEVISGPLTGIKIVEIAGIGPGPCAGMMLADMGAEVILVERKVASALAAVLEADGDGNKHMFFNRGKKSIAVNLKESAGVELVLKLIDEADVLIEGFRPGVMERLGLGPDICLQRNPKLVYGRMTGWGQTGPLAHAAGHDPNYIGISGALWYGGSKGRAPTAPITLVGDLGGGTMMLAWGILCAVIQAQKTGEGQIIDAAITDGSAYLSSLLWMSYNTGQSQDTLGESWVDGGAPWNATYECLDGKFVTVCALEPQFYQEFLVRLNLTDNQAFAGQWDTILWPQCREVLKELFLSKTRQQWCDLLEGTDVCFGPVLDFSEAPKHPHNLARNTFLNINGVTQPAPAPKLSGYQPSVGVPPKTAQHNTEIMRELGLDEQAIENLKTKGVV